MPFLGVFGRSGLAAFPGLRKVLGELSKSGKVVIYDPRGTGASSEGPVPTTPLELAEDLENVILEAEASPSWLLVHHDAAAAAITLSIRRPDLVAGMLFDSSFARFRLGDGYKEGAAESWVAPLASKFNLDPEAGLAQLLEDGYALSHEAAATTAKQVLTGVGPEARAALTRFFLTADVREDLAGSIAPVLVTHGTKNTVVPIAASRFLATNLGNKDFQQIDGAGHFLMNAAPDRWLEAAAAFIRRRTTA